MSSEDPLDELNGLSLQDEIQPLQNLHLGLFLVAPVSQPGTIAQVHGDLDFMLQHSCSKFELCDKELSHIKEHTRYRISKDPKEECMHIVHNDAELYIALYINKPLDFSNITITEETTNLLLFKLHLLADFPPVDCRQYGDKRRKEGVNILIHFPAEMVTTAYAVAVLETVLLDYF
jgi:hypothetical protein